MAKVLLLETQKDSPISTILHSLGHSIIRIDLEEGGKRTQAPSKIDTVPDLILWDEDIPYSPLHFLPYDLAKGKETHIVQIAILRTYDQNFIRSWVGGSHYGFLLRPVSEPAVISVVENALIHLLQSPQDGVINQGNFLPTVIDSLERPLLVIDAETLEVILANTAAKGRAMKAGVHCYELSHGHSSPCTGNEQECPLTRVLKTGEAYSTEHLYEEQLKSAKMAVEEAILAKSRFIANMSHELRTPLNIILGYSELLAQEETVSAKQEKIYSVQRAGKDLLAMVNDILDFSQIEADRLDLEYELFSIRDLITYQPTFFNQQLSKKQINLELDIAEDMPFWFYGDQHRMHQIVTNLLSNAIKFTPAGRIILSCSYVEEKLVIEVADTGIGIEPDRYDKLFIPFEQIEAAPNRSYSGTGLGLVIVKRLVEKMEGDIQVESTPGEGSRFTVTLPLQPSPSTRARASTSAQEEAQPMSSHEKGQNRQAASGQGTLHILVAEDNKVNQQLMRLILKNFGHTCDTVPEGKTALTYLKSQRYDLAIIDMHMPVMDGYQLVKEIRKDPMLQGLTVFSLSAATSQAETDEFLKIGCNDYLHKPVDTHELKNKINRLVNKID